MTRLKNIVERFRRRIETAIKGKDPTPLFSIETLLLVFSVVYGGAMGIRARLYEKGVFPTRALPCRVVSIGNIVSGGTGKTPMTIFVSRMIKDLGYRVVVISRGYKGRMENKGGVVSDGRTIFKGPEDAGDEPFLMARILKGIPVVVGRHRYDTGMMAIQRFRPDVIVLDDAFQHIRLKRDLDLVLLDSRSPIANGHLLPRGMLRESMSALRRADAIIFTRSHGAVPPSILGRLPRHRPIFFTAHTPIIRKANTGERDFYGHGADLSSLTGKKTLAFSGLGDNEQFFNSLEQAGCELVYSFSFPDHHRYRLRDLDRIAETAKEKGAEILVTTLKDYVKIEKGKKWPLALVAVDVRIRIAGGPERFNVSLSEALERPAGRMASQKSKDSPLITRS